MDFFNIGLRREDVIGGKPYVKGAECFRCHRRKPIDFTICIECGEIFCQQHIDDHRNCVAGI